MLDCAVYNSCSSCNSGSFSQGASTIPTWNLLGTSYESHVELLRISLGASTISLGTSQDFLESHESCESYNGPKSKANQPKSNPKSSQIQIKPNPNQNRIKIQPNQNQNLIKSQEILEKSQEILKKEILGLPHWGGPLTAAQPLPTGLQGTLLRSPTSERSERGVGTTKEVLGFIIDSFAFKYDFHRISYSFIMISQDLYQDSIMILI